MKLVNVHSGEVLPAHIGIKNGRIVTHSALEYTSARTIDAAGAYAIPGFIDTHVHIDSTLLTPEHLAALIVPHGTTTMLADPMEVSNVAGMEGLRALVQLERKLAYHLFVEVPSRVPTAPGLETTGGELNLLDVSEILGWENTVSLGELDPSKVFGLQDEYLLKISKAEELGKISNGHTAGLSGKDLTAYACGGLSDDHECVDFEAALQRLRLGLAILIREGSSERNLEPILVGALKAGIDFSNLMFCTDDKHPTDIQCEGHLDYMVNKAIQLGIPPVVAIQMATLNAARHFRIDHLVGSLTPGRYADVILSQTLDQIRPEMVFFQGEQVSAGNQLLSKPQTAAYPDILFNTIRLTRGRAPDDFSLHADGVKCRVWVIELIRDQIINNQRSAQLRVEAGVVQPDVEQDILKLAVVERYGKNGNIGISFVRGFGLKRGAIASSVSHDHHNIVVTGCSDSDMALCVRAVEEMNGGLAIVADGKVLARLPLPIAGLMSDLSSESVIDQLDELNLAYAGLGGRLASPFMALSFISLPTVPELGLTDKGLIDVQTRSIISAFCND